MTQQRRNSKRGIICLYCAIITLGLLWLGLAIWGGIVLFKSVSIGREFVKSTCTVTSSYSDSLCYSFTSSCYSQNNNIWWYNYWGSRYFIYITGGTGDANDDNNYDGDGDGGDTGDGDDGGDGDTGDDGGDDDGDDGGGFDEGGGISIDGEMLRFIKKKESTSGASDLSNVREFKNFKKSSKYNQDKSFIKSKINSNRNNINNLVADEDSNCEFLSYCFQGVFNVEYMVGNRLLNSTILGLVSPDINWVSYYLGLFNIGSSYYCYYDSDQEDNVIWFDPPKYDKKSLIVFLVFTPLFVIFAGLLYFFLKSQNNKNSYSRIN